LELVWFAVRNLVNVKNVGYAVKLKVFLGLKRNIIVKPA